MVCLYILETWHLYDLLFILYLKTMEKELYHTNNKLISKLNIYFDLSPSQVNDICMNLWGGAVHELDSHPDHNKETRPRTFRLSKDLPNRF